HSNWLWRASLIFGAVPALLIIFIRGKYLTESPIWLANQGDLKGAARVLQESYAINAVATVEKVERTAEKKKREGFAV
ncbi:MFS transporter, partial [Klebsiella pneumoniae]|nr:MFS transporter [Klebsiella pneumoniae]